MPSPRAPSMPTKRQIQEAYEVARNLCPGARIKGVGPEGVIFEYPEVAGSNRYENKPFTGDTQ